MKIGLYLFASLSMMVIVGILAYLVSPNNFNINFLLFDISLPVAIWVMLPLAILIFFTTLHILFYGAKNFLKMRKLHKDIDAIQENLYWSILQEPRQATYALSEMQDNLKVLEHGMLIVDDEVEIKNEKLAQAIEITRKIDNGEYVNFKNYKIKNKLSSNNPLLIQNQCNRLKEDSKFVSKVLQNKLSYDNEVVAEALDTLSNTATFQEAEKYLTDLNINHFNIMLTRYSNGEDVGLTPEIMHVYIDSIKFNCQDYIKLALCVSKQWTPDEALAFFSSLQQKDEKAESGYLYLLFAYEMMSNIKDFFDANPENEFKKFKMFYALKQVQSGHKIEDLIDTNTLCDNA